jgi:hypothetical protein
MSGLIGRRHTGRVSDAPAYRIWPPVALGVPLLVDDQLGHAAARA